MKEKKLFKYIFYLSIAGILLAIYLLWEQITQSSFRPCNLNSTINCDAIISGAVSKTLGLPTPLYGLIGYVVIAYAALFKKKKVLLATAGFGLVFCLWIAYQELFLLQVICPVCILCQLIMVSVFTLASLIVRKNK